MLLRRDLRKIYLFELFRNLHLVSAVLIPFFTDWGGLNLTQTMWLQSWFIAWIFLLEIPTGSIADVLGRKISLSIGALVGSIAALVYSSYPNFSLFMLGELLYALSYSLFSGADKAMIYDTLKMHGKEKESKKIFGKAFTFKMIGMLIGAPLGSLIAGYLGVRYAMMFMFFPLFTSFLIGLSLKEPERGERAKSYFQVFKEGMNVIRSDKELLALICNYVAFYVIAYYTIWMYQPLLLEAGMNISLLGFVHSALIIAQMILANSYAFLEDLLGRKKLIMLNPIVLGLSFVFCGISNGLIPLLLLVILSAGFGKSRDPLMQSYLNEFIPSKQRATVLSTISMLSRLILAFTNLLIGMLMDVSVKYAYLILGFITLFLSFALRVDAREKAY